MTEYYAKKCKCGCGKFIEVKPYHKYNGIPDYIKGHWRKNNKKYFWECGKGHKQPDEGKCPEKCITCGQTRLTKNL